MPEVLIIDDDDIVLLVESKILQRCGVSKSPLTFSSGKLALEYLKLEDKTQNYIILLDINMPVMSGWDVLKELEQLELPKRFFVIMVTSSIDRYDRELAKNHKNVIGFVEKPITKMNCEEIKSLPEIEHFYNNS